MLALFLGDRVAYESSGVLVNGESGSFRSSEKTRIRD